MKKEHERIIKDINGSYNPFKTAIDHGCKLLIRKQTDYEKKHRIVPLDIVFPTSIREIKVNVKFELGE